MSYGEHVTASTRPGPADIDGPGALMQQVALAKLIQYVSRHFPTLTTSHIVHGLVVVGTSLSYNCSKPKDVKTTITTTTRTPAPRWSQLLPGAGSTPLVIIFFGATHDLP